LRASRRMDATLGLAAILRDACGVYHRAALCADPVASKLLRMRFDKSPPSIKSMKMMDRPVTMADTKAIGRRDRGADESLGVTHGAFKILALGKAGGDR
jgi:hypothetical protein